MSIVNRFIRASFWAAGMTYIFFAINFIGQIVMARLLMPKYFGLFAFVFAIREVINIFMGFSVSQAFIYSDGKQKDFNECISIALIALIAFVLFGAIMFLPMLDFYGYQYAAMLFVLCASQGILNLASNYLAPLEKDLNYKRSALVRGVASSSSVLFAIIVAYMSRSIWSLGLREFLQAAILLLLSVKLGGFSFQLKHFGENLKSKLHFGIRTAVANGMATFYYRIADLLVHGLFGQLLLGYFYQARYLAYLPVKLSQPFTQDVVFSFLTNYRHDAKVLGNNIYWLNYVAIRLFLPIVFLVFFFGQDVFYLVYGSRWREAGILFSYSSGLIMFSILFSNLAQACYAIGKQFYTAQAYFIGLSVFIVLIFCLPSIENAMVFFSLGISIGYFYMLLRLYCRGATFDVLSLFSLPALIVFALFFIRHENKLLVTLFFMVAYFLMLFTERGKIKALLAASWRAVRNHD